MKSLLILPWCGMLAWAFDAGTPRIENLRLAQSEDGVPLPSNYKFQAGDVIFFSARVNEYGRVGDSSKEDTAMSLTYRIETRDAKQILVLPIEDGRVAGRLAPEDKEWRPIVRYTITLPPLLDSGRYEVSLWIRDEVGRGEARASLSFEVTGPRVEPSATLVIRNFRFLRSEEDKDPLPVAAYRPGETLWIRFEMTGYKLGGKNDYDLEYGIKVLKPDGGVSYEQPKAAADKNDSFYPQRYTPAALSLSLPRDVPKGEYTVLVTVRDNLGKQTCESRDRFSVE